jgi:hypothetical protein
MGRPAGADHARIADDAAGRNIKGAADIDEEAAAAADSRLRLIARAIQPQTIGL